MKHPYSFYCTSKIALLESVLFVSISTARQEKLFLRSLFVGIVRFPFLILLVSFELLMVVKVQDLGIGLFGEETL